MLSLTSLWTRLVPWCGDLLFIGRSLEPTSEQLSTSKKFKLPAPDVTNDLLSNDIVILYQKYPKSAFKVAGALLSYAYKRHIGPFMAGKTPDDSIEDWVDVTNKLFYGLLVCTLF